MRISRRVETLAPGRPLGSGNNARDGQCRGMHRRPLTVVLALSLLCMRCVDGAQPASALRNTYPQPDYHPSMGDLMTIAVQPRHIKLGLAGKRQNWIYAKYELGELRNAFTRIGRTIPKYQSIDVTALATALLRTPLEAVGQAISAKDASQFDMAYAQLTEACNVCHRNRNHAEIVIKVPDAAMFPDQEFQPLPLRQ
jgi:hypothetical protein